MRLFLHATIDRVPPSSPSIISTAIRMRWRNGALVITFSSTAECVTAECWLRDDGTEICSPEPLAWRLAWWFWFTTLVLVLVFLGCGDRVCCCCLVREKKRTKGEEEADDGDRKMMAIEDKALVEPLLPQPMRKVKSKTKRCCESQQLHPVKPMYRYLDP